MPDPKEMPPLTPEQQAVVGEVLGKCYGQTMSSRSEDSATPQDLDAMIECMNGGFAPGATPPGLPKGITPGR